MKYGRVEKMEFIRKCYGRAILLARWLFLAGIAGVILGIFGGLFGNSITYVTAFRNAHPWMLYLLPAAGLAIVALYKLDPYKTGTNRVLEGIQSDTYVPLRMAPLIVVSTILTHALVVRRDVRVRQLQLGGSIGGTLGKWMKFDEYRQEDHDHVWHERRIFSVVRNTIDGNRIRYGSDQCGIIQYAALVPCAVASLTAHHQVAILVGSGGETFILGTVPEFTLINAALVVILAVLCAAVGIFFCKVLHKTEHWYKEMIPK